MHSYDDNTGLPDNGLSGSSEDTDVEDVSVMVNFSVPAVCHAHDLKWLLI